MFAREVTMHGSRLYNRQDWEEAIHPGGGEVEVFIACAEEVHELIEGLAEVLLRQAVEGEVS